MHLASILSDLRSLATLYRSLRRTLKRIHPSQCLPRHTLHHIRLIRQVRQLHRRNSALQRELHEFRAQLSGNDNDLAQTLLDLLQWAAQREDFSPGDAIKDHHLTEQGWTLLSARALRGGLLTATQTLRSGSPYTLRITTKGLSFLRAHGRSVPLRKC